MASPNLFLLPGMTPSSSSPPLSPAASNAHRASGISHTVPAANTITVLLETPSHDQNKSTLRKFIQNTPWALATGAGTRNAKKKLIVHQSPLDSTRCCLCERLDEKETRALVNLLSIRN